jgi:hypothetical protein
MQAHIQTLKISSRATGNNSDTNTHMRTHIHSKYLHMVTANDAHREQNGISHDAGIET